MADIIWDKTAREKFEAVLSHIPAVLRSIAAQKVSQKAEVLARREDRLEVSLRDVVDAFFMETPFGFHGPMKIDMKASGIDYEKFGH